MSDKEEEPGEPDDDQQWDTDYNPFFDKPLFRDRKRKTHEGVVRDPRVKKEESTGSNAEEKPLKAPFKEVNEDDFFVDDDWYDPRGLDSLRYHYSEEDVQYILKRRVEKQAVVAEKEVIDLTGDSD